MIKRLIVGAKALLGHRWWPVLVAGIAVLLVSPCLWAGLIADDYIQTIRLRPDLSFPGFEHTTLDLFTFRVRPDGGFLRSEFEQMMRGLSQPLTPGTEVVLSDLRVAVTEVVDDGRAAEAEFHFAVPLESPSLLWMRWKGAALAPYAPPAIGGTELLPGADLALVLAGPD